jgi:folate-binding protein YgfZ
MTASLRFAILQDRTVLAMGGADRVKFLQGLLTNDMRRLAPDRALYAGFLTGQGKLVCDLFVIEDGERILIDIAESRVADLLGRLTRFKLGSAVEFGKATPAVAMAVVWGEGTPARLGLDATEGAAARIPLAAAHCAFVDPRLAAMGARIVYQTGQPIEAALAALGVAGATAADYTLHRIALGIADTPEFGQEQRYPLEANFELLHGVDFKKGCYVGQEVTARMNLRGSLRHRVLPVTGAAPLPDAGAPVTAHGTELGSLIAASGTSGLALLHLERLAGVQPGELCAKDVPLSVQWPDWLGD